MSKKVLITGILGQDGATMAEYLLENTDCRVIGIHRRTSQPSFENVEGILKNPRLEIIQGDITDDVSVKGVVQYYTPDYFINFAANSFVGSSWNTPIQVFEVNTLGVIRCLEAIRHYAPSCRFYSAGSSEEFGNVVYSPQDIYHPIRPRSPYGASKAAARHIVKTYRESYGMYAIHGILFNHEGIYRGREFLTRKVTCGIAAIHYAIHNNLPFSPMKLGNLESKRDWSDATDFADGIWKMLNQPTPKEYVLASGETHSVREFVARAFESAGLRGTWSGQDFAEKFVLQEGIGAEVCPTLFRPAEVSLLLGDSKAIKKELGWSPKISFENLIDKMVKNDIMIHYANARRIQSME